MRHKSKPRIKMRKPIRHYNNPSNIEMAIRKKREMGLQEFFRTIAYYQSEITTFVYRMQLASNRFRQWHKQFDKTVCTIQSFQMPKDS